MALYGMMTVGIWERRIIYRFRETEIELTSLGQTWGKGL